MGKVVSIKEDMDPVVYLRQLADELEKHKGTDTVVKALVFSFEDDGEGSDIKVTQVNLSGRLDYLKKMSILQNLIPGEILLGHGYDQ